NPRNKNKHYDKERLCDEEWLYVPRVFERRPGTWDYVIHRSDRCSRCGGERRKWRPREKGRLRYVWPAVRVPGRNGRGNQAEGGRGWSSSEYSRREGGFEPSGHRGHRRVV